MKTHFQGKYRIQSARLPDWDYSNPGYYFVTICTRKHFPFLGVVANGIVNLSAAGTIAAQEWQNTGLIRSTITLDAWVIMPNHVHGIIVIEETSSDLTCQSDKQLEQRRWKPNTLGVMVNQYKGRCTKRIRRSIDPGFAWQARFCDHIIRSEQALERIRKYILSNPLNWHADDSIDTGK
jgi:putative transposase